MPSLQDPSDAPPAAAPLDGRKRWAVVACLTAVGLFAGAFALLYVAWLPHENPSAMVIVQGDASSLGMSVLVRATSPDSHVPPLRADITPRDNYRVRVHVPPGPYEVTLERDGKSIGSLRRVASHDDPIYLTLIQPATRPAPGG